MKCEGDKYCERIAEYSVKHHKENEVTGEKYIGWDYVCGYCLMAQYVSSNGLKKGVLEVVRLG